MNAMLRLLTLLGFMISSSICDVIDGKSDTAECAAGLCGRMERLESLVLRLQSTVTWQDAKLEDQEQKLKWLLKERSRDRAELVALRALCYKFSDDSATAKHQSHLAGSFRNATFNSSMSNDAQPFKSFELNDVEHSGSSLHQDVHYVTSYDSRVLNDADSVRSNFKSRSDDGGPLEAVVMQTSQQLTAMQADVQVLKTEALQNAPSSTFIHWGSSSCTDHSQLVYSGVMGGGVYSYSGSGTNNLCMTLTPVISDHSLPHTHTSWLGYIAGAEYESDDAHQDVDAVCAVCQSNHATTIMIPGTNVCTTGWTKQYSGIIMGGIYNQASGSEYICVDPAMEGHLAGNRNDDGHLLYYVVTVCGSLPCQPYVNSKMINCVVCSR